MTNCVTGPTLTENPPLGPKANRGLCRFGGSDVIDLATAAELAARIARIRPISNANPHAFYEERSEVASQIRRVAARLRSPEPAPAAAADVPAAVGRQATRHETRHVGDRTILVLTRSSAPSRAKGIPIFTGL